MATANINQLPASTSQSAADLLEQYNTTANQNQKITLAQLPNGFVQTQQFQLGDDEQVTFNVSTTKPNFVRLSLVCLTADAGMSVGDEVGVEGVIANNTAFNTWQPCLSWLWDGTNFSVLFDGSSTANGGIMILSPNSGTSTVMKATSMGNFAVKVRYF